MSSTKRQLYTAHPCHEQRSIDDLRMADHLPSMLLRQSVLTVIRSFVGSMWWLVVFTEMTLEWAEREVCYCDPFAILCTRHTKIPERTLLFLSFLKRFQKRGRFKVSLYIYIYIWYQNPNNHWRAKPRQIKTQTLERVATSRASVLHACYTQAGDELQTNVSYDTHGIEAGLTSHVRWLKHCTGIQTYTLYGHTYIHICVCVCSYVCV